MQITHGLSAQQIVRDANDLISLDGKFFYLYFDEFPNHTYVLPVSATGLPEHPSQGISNPEQGRPVSVISNRVLSGLGPAAYAYVHSNTQRNLYRIPLQ